MAHNRRAQKTEQDDKKNLHQDRSQVGSMPVAAVGRHAQQVQDVLQGPVDRQIRQSVVADHAGRRGNRATSAAVQRRKQGAGDDESTRRVARSAQERDPIVETTMDFGQHVHQPQWRTERRVEPANPFASGAGTEQVQRQDAAAGGVEFTVSSFSATVGAGLNVSESAGGLRLSSNRYTATGTVTAVGPKSRVKNWDIGFLQTVFRSDRNFYWGSTARTKYSDNCSPLPVRDGDALKQPWYGLETVSPFSEAASDSQTATMNDTPGTARQPWADPRGTDTPEPDSLAQTDGKDIFRSWLAVRNRTDFHKLYLRHADWEVDYSTAVDVSKAIGSRATAGGNAGGKVTGTGNGRGGKQPSLFDPVANDAARDTFTKW